MITHPATWDTDVALMARPAYRVTAYSPSNRFGAPLDVPVVDGWVLKDATQYPRTHVSVTMGSTSLLPTAIDPNLTPFGGWLKVEAGYTDTAGATTYVTIADGPITRVAANRPGGQLVIESADVSVLQAQRVTPTDQAWDSVTYPGAYNMAQALATNFLDPSGVNITGTNGVDYTTWTAAMKSVPVPTGYVWKAGTTAWSAVEYLSDLCGAETYGDAQRKIIMRPIPTIGTPAATLATGEGGTITAIESVLQRTYNVVYLAYASGIVGTWQAAANYSGDTFDPVYYGRFCLYESRDGTPTQLQANDAARAYAYRVKGTGRTTTIRAVPMPWLEPGDTIQVDPDGAPTEQHLLQSITIPLTLDVMTVTTRNPPYTGAL